MYYYHILWTCMQHKFAFLHVIVDFFLGNVNVQDHLLNLMCGVRAVECLNRKWSHVSPNVDSLLHTCYPEREEKTYYPRLIILCLNWSITISPSIPSHSQPFPNIPNQPVWDHSSCWNQSWPLPSGHRHPWWFWIHWHPVSALPWSRSSWWWCFQWWSRWWLLWWFPWWFPWWSPSWSRGSAWSWSWAWALHPANRPSYSLLTPRCPLGRAFSRPSPFQMSPLKSLFPWQNRMHTSTLRGDALLVWCCKLRDDVDNCICRRETFLDMASHDVSWIFVPVPAAGWYATRSCR